MQYDGSESDGLLNLWSNRKGNYLLDPEAETSNGMEICSASKFLEPVHHVTILAALDPSIRALSASPWAQA